MNKCLMESPTEDNNMHLNQIVIQLCLYGNRKFDYRSKKGNFTRRKIVLFFIFGAFHHHLWHSHFSSALVSWRRCKQLIQRGWKTEELFRRQETRLCWLAKKEVTQSQGTPAIAALTSGAGVSACCRKNTSPFATSQNTTRPCKRKHCCPEGRMDRQAGRQRPTDRQINYIDRKTDGYIDGEIHGDINRKTDRYINGPMDGYIERRIDT